MRPTEFMSRLAKAFDETAPDYKTAAESFFHGEASYWKGDLNWKTKEPWDDTPDGFKNISFKEVDSYGGEGEGNNYYTVYQFTDNDTGGQVYVKFQGWYASYEGAEYESWSFVQPKGKTVTVYE
jgi:hypothetical protein